MLLNHAQNQDKQPTAEMEGDGSLSLCAEPQSDSTTVSLGGAARCTLPESTERSTRSCTSVMFHTGVMLVTFRFLFPFFLCKRQYMVQRKGAERALFKSCWQGHPSRPVPVIRLRLWSARGKPPPPCTVRPVLLSLAEETAAGHARRVGKFTGAPAGLCCCHQPGVQGQSPFSLPAAQPPPHLRLWPSFHTSSGPPQRQHKILESR